MILLPLRGPSDSIIFIIEGPRKRGAFFAREFGRGAIGIHHRSVFSLDIDTGSY